MCFRNLDCHREVREARVAIQLDCFVAARRRCSQ
jgi:hypothetical protein